MFSLFRNSEPVTNRIPSVVGILSSAKFSICQSVKKTKIKGKGPGLTLKPIKLKKPC